MTPDKRLLEKNQSRNRKLNGGYQEQAGRRRYCLLCVELNFADEEFWG